MKIDVENIIVLQTVMKSLAQGVDPMSNVALPNDTVLNSKILQSCFADACEVFDFLKKNIDAINNLTSRKITNEKMPFHIEKAEYDYIELSDIPITISRFVFIINEVCQRQNMKKLKATQITSWLEVQGYLKKVKTKNGNFCKVATVYGENIGITSIKKVNSRGEEYITNVYDRNAQKFVLTCAIPCL